jgi:tRNA nucleotidyltransferase (CCA-adding enzyme)
MNTKPGPWMKDALDIVMAWQLRNADITDPAQAIEAVKSSRDSELPSLLASHILQLIIRPLFSQAKPPTSNKTTGKRSVGGGFGEEEAPAWKDPKEKTAIELLRWALSALDEKGLEANWKLLYPPILKMLDDSETQWKVTGCELLTQLLRTARPSFLSRTGLGPVFETTLRPFFAYLPTLTPEEEAAALMDATLPAMMQLAEAMYHSDALTSADASLLDTKRIRLLNDIVNQGVLAPLTHALPSTYPLLATTILTHLPPLFAKLGINTVRHLPSLISSLSLILQNPFILAKSNLVLATISALKALIENAWPRIYDHLPVLMGGVAKCWWRCCEEEEGKGGQKDGQKGTDIEGIKAQLQEVIAMLDAVLGTNDAKKEEWEKQKLEIVEASKWMEGLFKEGSE